MKKKSTSNIARTDTHDILPPKGWKHPPKSSSNLTQTDIGGLLSSLREVIKTARQQVLHAVDVVQVQTCWTAGQHIVEFEQGGAARAAYGKRLLADLAESLTAEFGKGFDSSNLRYMRLFYQTFPKCDALRHELSWTQTSYLRKSAQSVDKTSGANPQISQIRADEFGKGFDERNLRHMRAFYITFTNWNALRSELSWTQTSYLRKSAQSVDKTSEANPQISQIRADFLPTGGKT